MVDAPAGDNQRVVQLHRVGKTEIEPMLALGDHDREAAVRREVEVVRVADADGLAFRPPGERAERRQAVALVVVDPERLEVIRRRHMLG